MTSEKYPVDGEMSNLEVKIPRSSLYYSGVRNSMERVLFFFIIFFLR